MCLPTWPYPKLSRQFGWNGAQNAGNPYVAQYVDPISIYSMCVYACVRSISGYDVCLTLNLLTTTIFAPPSNASNGRWDLTRRLKG
jgi:hypothetical protein